MRNLTRIVFLFILLVIPKASFAQPKVVTESPQTSSIGRYWDVPVGGYTGTPDINVPLHELQIGGITLPISLSYHASGVKVKDEASWVGLGWTLNVGGVINKVVNGDEDTQSKLELGSDKSWHGTNVINSLAYKREGFLSVDKNIIKNILFSSYHKTRYQYSNEMEGYKDLDFINMLYQSNSGQYLFGNDASGRAIPPLIDMKPFGKSDLSPDLYLCNVNGISGSWMYGLDNKPYEVKSNNLKIEGGPNAWILTDAKGTKYVFNDYGRSNKLAKTYYTYTPSYSLYAKVHPDSLPDSSYRYNSNVSSAHLNKIVSSTGEEVNIFYSKHIYNNRHAPNITYNKEWMDAKFDIGGLRPENAGNTAYNDVIRGLMQDFPSADNVVYTSTLEQSSVEEFYPDSITSRNEVIRFIKSPRLDIPNGIRLSEIAIYRKSSAGLNLVKRIIFDNNQYFPLRAPAVKDTDKRLKLNSVEKMGVINGQSDLGDKFSFVYENTPLPPKSYYQGSLSNMLQTLNRYDNQDEFGYISYLGTPYTSGKSNIDPKNNQSGILQKIIYPTGGYQEYKYEPNVNQFGTLKPGLRVKEISLKMGDSLLLKQEYAYTNGAELQFNYFSNKQLAFKIVTEYNSEYIRALVYRNVISTAPYRSINIGGYGSEVFVYGNIDIAESGITKNGKTSYLFSTSDNDFQKKEDLIRSFPVGTALSNMPDSYPTGEFPLFIIPQIKYSTSLGNLLKKTVYKFSNNEYTKVLEEENKYLTNPESRGPEQTIKVNGDVPIYRKSSPIWDFSFASSAPDVSNPAVSVINQNFPGEFGGAMLGMKSGEYLPAWRQTYTNLLEAQILFLQQNPILKRYWYPSQILLHNIPKFYKKLDQQTTRSYDQNDVSKFVEKIRKFGYNTAEDIDANKITDILSNGDTMEYAYLYSKDAAINQLDTKHILSEVVETSAYRISNNVKRLISQEKNTYHTDKPLLREKLKLDVIKSSFDIDYTINKYDVNSNVQEVTNSGGIKKSYHWNKAKTFPIAEATNVEVTDFFYESFEDNGIISNAHTGSGSLTGFYNPVSFFTKPENGKNYLINYWYLNNGVWKNSGNLTYTGQTLNGTLDDIRIFPEDSSLSTYTYDNAFGLTSKTDEKNYTVFYNYDEHRRLKSKKDENQNIIELYNYNYSTDPNWVDLTCSCLTDPQGANTGQVTKTQKNFNPRSGASYNTLRSVTSTDRTLCPFINAGLTKSFYKNDCLEGTGSLVEYSIPAGQYSSVISQQDADNKALLGMNATGQTYANSKGVCEAEFRVENFVNDINSTITVKFINLSSLKVYEVTAKGGGGVTAKQNISIPGGSYRIEIKGIGIKTPFSAIALNIGTMAIGYTATGTIINHTFNNQQILAGNKYNIVPITELP